MFLALALFAMPAVAGEFDTRLAEAERLRLKAAEAGHEWLETAKILEQAREEADRGNLENALALVEKAILQADAAIRQAEREAGAWRSRVLE